MFPPAASKPASPPSAPKANAPMAPPEDDGGDAGADDLDLSGPFAAAGKALAVAMQEQDILQAAAGAKSIRIDFADDGSVDVAVTGDGGTVKTTVAPDELDAIARDSSVPPPPPT